MSLDRERQGLADGKDDQGFMASARGGRNQIINLTMGANDPQTGGIAIGTHRGSIQP